MKINYLNRHSAHPYHCGGEVDEGEEMECTAVEAGCEATEVLELVEASLDAVARFVEGGVVRNLDFA